MSKILLTGSSIFEMWSNAAQSAPEHPVVNRAIGGTMTPYWKDVLSSVLATESPDVLWMYCGSNDLCGKTVPDDIAENIIACRQIATTHSPALRFAYFSIIKAPQKRARWDVIDSIHSDIRARLMPDDLFVDLNEIFFPSGAPARELFEEDELHLTAEAYDAMVELTQPLMQKWLSG